jgi:hypothetical protein
VKLLPGDKRGERELIKLARLHFDIWEIVFAEAWPYQRPVVARLTFQSSQSQSFGVIWPVNLPLFKSLPHGVEPSQAG